MPMAALEEKIEQELATNPVLELKTSDPDAYPISRAEAEADSLANRRHSEEERPLNISSTDADTAGDFNRLEKLGEYLANEEFSTNDYHTRSSGGTGGGDGERDGKMDALANSPDHHANLTDHLLAQWRLVSALPDVQHAGQLIISRIENDGYLRIPLEQLATDEAGTGVTRGLLETTLRLVQQLDPAGVGARDLPECLLLQLDALDRDDELSEGHDFLLERALVRYHLKDLEANRYPLIAKRLERSIDDIKAAVRRLSRLPAHPGRSISSETSQPIFPDAIIRYDPDTKAYTIEMARDPAANLSLSKIYQRMVQKPTEGGADKTTREFLMNHVRNAKWLLESIQQRQNTLQRVIRQVLDHQRDFFDNGPEHLRPLPMIDVADRLGIHVATVSRAVSEKYIQTPRGIFPLRRFFSGGTTSEDGTDMSWDAVKEKLKAIIAEEDKHKPLSDDDLAARLGEQGITLARRTVAKYREQLGLPTARQRKQH